MSGSDRENGLWISTGNPFTVSEATPFAPGQLGKVCSFGNASAENGVSGQTPIEVQFVKRYATDTITVAAGDLAFWQDTDAYVVTADLAQALGGTTEPLVAGVFGAATPSTNSYGFIQVAGVALGRFADSTSCATVGKSLIWNTNRQLKQAGTQDSDSPVVAVLRTANTATTTNITAEIILCQARHTW